MTTTPIPLVPCRINGEVVTSDDLLEVRYPYTGEVVSHIPMLTPADGERAIESALAGGPMEDHYERFRVLEKARQLLEQRSDEFADYILKDTGLCKRETRYEVGRCLDVLLFAAMESIRDEGQVLCGDVSPHGKKRRILTVREPLPVALAITPFNHPLNQVVHKVAPSIAAGTPVILKPSEKAPTAAIKFTELLLEAGLPGHMIAVLLGPVETTVRSLIEDDRISLVSFTGGTDVGKAIAHIAGYKKLCLELGGNSPLIVHADADLELAVQLAAEGCFRNSGQRCTAVKRLLVDRSIIDTFTEAFVSVAATYTCGDPEDEATRVGTVIDEDAAKLLERRVRDAEAMGARVLHGGSRDGALMEPTVIADVPRDAEMVRKESFGPLAPILVTDGIDDAIALANDSAYGLSAGVVTTDLSVAMTAAKRIRTGTVNINDVPGWRTETSPFGGVKDSGLGIKEGVVEAMKVLSTVKSISLPW